MMNNNKFYWQTTISFYGLREGDLNGIWTIRDAYAGNPVEKLRLKLYLLVIKRE